MSRRVANFNTKHESSRKRVAPATQEPPKKPEQLPIRTNGTSDNSEIKKENLVKDIGQANELVVPNEVNQTKDVHEVGEVNGVNGL